MHIARLPEHSVGVAHLSHAFGRRGCGLLDDLRAFCCSGNIQQSAELHLSRFGNSLTKRPFEQRVCPKRVIECINGVFCEFYSFRGII